MKGNAEEHPDAHLIFRIFVDSIQETPRSKQKNKTKNNKKGTNNTNQNEKQSAQQEE